MTDRAVLFSIKPKYCELIASGKKTIEVRKTRPKLETPFKCYIYCTQSELLTKSHLTGGIYVACNKKYKKLLELRGNLTLSGKVIGEFVCEHMSVDAKGYNQDGVPAHWTLLNGYCLTADELDGYGKGKMLYGLHISNLKIYDKPKELSEFGLKRPPQPWCYVEDKR